jgi:hypothetical protein
VARSDPATANFTDHKNLGDTRIAYKPRHTYTHTHWNTRRQRKRPTWQLVTYLLTDHNKQGGQNTNKNTQTWPHCSDRFQKFFCHINGIRTTIKFTMETEAYNNIHFVDAHVIRKQTSITTTVYRKPTHTGRSLNFHSDHPPHVKRGIIRNLHNRATIICRERQQLAYEVNIKHDLQLNGFPKNSSA